jgi:hypothetical protein
MADRGPLQVSLPVAELMAVAHEYDQAKRLDDAERLLTHTSRPIPSMPPPCT